MTIDAMISTYYDLSSYNYSLNNPCNFIDPDGNVVKDKQGNVVFTSSGKQVSWESTGPINVKINADGSKTYQYVSSNYTEGSIYADNGKAIQAYSYKNSDLITVSVSPTGEVKSTVSKKIDPEKYYVEAKTDCHGLVFTEGKLWINDPEMQTLLDNDDVMQTGIESLADFVMFKYGTKFKHSAERNEDGTYDDNSGAYGTEYGRTPPEASRGITSNIFVTADPTGNRNNNTGTVYFYFRIGNKTINTNLGQEKDGVRTISDKDEIAKFLQLLQNK